MHDPWQDRLSEYLDGALDAATARELEEHLVACDECAATLRDLRDVIAIAGAQQPAPPAADLWAGIAQRLEPRDVVPLAPRRAVRRISFSLPQAAAAAVLLMAITGTAVWLALRAGAGTEVSGTLVLAAGEPVPTAAQLVGTPAPAPDAAYEKTVAELEHQLEQRREQLDPATVEVLERSLAAIDEAIAAARAALEADPSNPYLHRQLDASMRRKLDVLRRAGGVVRGGA